MIVPQLLYTTTYCEGIIFWYQHSSITLIRYTLDLGELNLDSIGLSADKLGTWGVEAMNAGHY